MSSPAKFGRLARVYCWMEYLSFGPYLKRCRELRLTEIAACRRALVYGDGDGRFVAKLVRCASRIQVTAIDASSAMLRQAAPRLPSGAQVRLVCADALQYVPGELPEAPFDLVVTHFFLDCFSDGELRTLMTRVSSATGPGAMWIVSDFAIPEHGVRRLIGSWIVRGLYLAFGILTGLTTRRLPDHARVMRESGWVREDRRTLLGGLLISERWRRVTPGTEHASHRASNTARVWQPPTIMAMQSAIDQVPMRAGSTPGSPPDVFPDPYPPPGPDPDGPGFPEPDPDPAPLDPIPNPAPVN